MGAVKDMISLLPVHAAIPGTDCTYWHVNRLLIIDLRGNCFIVIYKQAWRKEDLDPILLINTLDVQSVLYSGMRLDSWADITLRTSWKFIRDNY